MRDLASNLEPVSILHSYSVPEYLYLEPSRGEGARGHKFPVAQL